MFKNLEQTLRLTLQWLLLEVEGVERVGDGGDEAFTTITVPTAALELALRLDQALTDYAEVEITLNERVS